MPANHGPLLWDSQDETFRNATVAAKWGFRQIRKVPWRSMTWWKNETGDRKMEEDMHIQMGTFYSKVGYFPGFFKTFLGISTVGCWTIVSLTIEMFVLDVFLFVQLNAGCLRLLLQRNGWNESKKGCIFDWYPHESTGKRLSSSATFTTEY